MTRWGLITKLRTLLRARVWPGTSTKVFDKDAVRITCGPVKQALRSMVPPICLIKPGSSQADPQHGEEQSLLQAEVHITLMVVVPGDEVGENALIGANINTPVDSQNRGLMDVEEQLLATIKTLNALDGEDVIIQSVYSGQAESELDEELGYIAWCNYSFVAQLTTDETANTAPPDP